MFKNTNTILKSVSMKRQPVRENEPCIYKINCNSCDRFYIGETIDFQRRKKEHSDALRNGVVTNPLFKHRQDENHRINVNDMEIVKKVHNVEKRRLIESILIQNTENINIYKSNYKLDSFIGGIIRKNVKSVDKLLNRLNPP